MSGAAVRYAAIAVALVLLLTLPIWVGNPYYINVASQILLFAVFALALNVLVGYAGLVSLGHAGLFAIAGYAAALMLQAGYGHLVADVRGDRRHARRLGGVRGAGAALDRHRLPDDHAGARPDRLGHRLSLGEPHQRRQRRQRHDAAGAVRLQPHQRRPSFYFATLVVFLLAVATMVLFVRSPFGASLRGTRDQARRMNALGYNVWLIRFLAFLFSGFWTGVAGLLFIYYNQFISPQVVGADRPRPRCC